MDTLGDFDNATLEYDDVDHDIGDCEVDIGTDERRMHVRAYNHWVSLLHGRAYPLIADLDPHTIADFGDNSVLLDFSDGADDPRIAFLGKTLRTECELAQGVTRINEVPGRSLLSRLTDHYLQIIANRAPIGFEAEFVGTRGHNTLYRGILMPFASAGETIDFIYGVINWKELVDRDTQAKLDAEIDIAVRHAPKVAVAPAIWADGPRANTTTLAPVDPAPTELLTDRLAMARETAAAARAADTRSRAALYRALGRAHDFAIAAGADPTGYERVLLDAGISVQERAPLIPVVKLVFGSEYDKTRLTEFAAVLTYARRHAMTAGSLPAVLESMPGGIKGVVAAERMARRPAAKPVRPAKAFTDHPTLATVALKSEGRYGSLVVLLARVATGDTLEIVAEIDEAGLTRRVVRAAT